MGVKHCSELDEVLCSGFKRPFLMVVDTLGVGQEYSHLGLGEDLPNQLLHRNWGFGASFRFHARFCQRPESHYEKTL